MRKANKLSLRKKGGEGSGVLQTLFFATKKKVHLGLGKFTEKDRFSKIIAHIMNLQDMTLKIKPRQLLLWHCYTC